MEALLLLIDALVLTLAIYMAFRDERQAGGTLQASLFRTSRFVEKAAQISDKRGWRGRPVGKKNR